MHSRLSGLLLAAVLVFVTPAWAQTPSAQAPAAQTHRNPEADFIAWVQHIQDLLQRAGGGMEALGRAGGAFDNTDPAARLAALHDLSTAAVQARATIAAIQPDLDAIQPFTEPGVRPLYYQLGTSLLTNTREVIGKLDDLLADMIDLVRAVDAHDTATVQRLSPRLIQGLVVLVQGQAIMLRARQVTITTSNPSYHTLTAMAAMYDGMAGLIGDGQNFDPAVTDRAADAIDQAVSQYRASLAPLPASPHPGMSDAQWEAALGILNRNIATDQGVAQVLRTAAQEGRAGASTIDIRMNHIAELSVFEQQYQQNSRDLLNVAAQAAQAGH
ncbi:MAG: hypothetical protein HY054_03605 [Proteobacteria bacterium]|nr:hypothetical protein [Pseudomonadota bacterium]